MHIVNTLKFAVGIASLLIGLVVLVRARGPRGFNKNWQIGALLLVVGTVFVAVGLGFDVRSLFR